ncbi:uncharacterized protein METZ01_LOCUS473941, partial [marine metagenome]
MRYSASTLEEPTEAGRRELEQESLRLSYLSANGRVLAD